MAFLGSGAGVPSGAADDFTRRSSGRHHPGRSGGVPQVAALLPQFVRGDGALIRRGRVSADAQDVI